MPQQDNRRTGAGMAGRRRLKPQWEGSQVQRHDVIATIAAILVTTESTRAGSRDGMERVGAQNWRNASVRALAVDDPVAWVTAQARALVYRAIEAGWTGPPFDPIELATLLRIPVYPSQDVLDARLVPHQAGVRIEFNPNRPPGRTRYSIAHEIGHALFPDHAEAARHRLSASRGEGHEAELELLCNLAAAELLMPIGSFPEASSADLTIDAVLDLRARYDLSTEAVLLRVGRLARDPVGVFAAAPQGRLSSDRYRIDYVIGPPGSFGSRRGDLVPERSAVNDCTAVGFTAKGTEQWPRNGGPIHVECVGIPPYPGNVLPRVAGLMLEPHPSHTDQQAIEFLVGDATSPRGEGPRIIVQVVNDATPRWGAGFAREVRKKWPSVEAAFKGWVAEEGGLRLGQVHFVDLATNLAIASMVAQHGYGPSAKPRIRYQALEACFGAVRDMAASRGAAVHAPRVGAGQAGGSWPVIEELINDILIRQGIKVVVYDLPNMPRPSSDLTQERQMPLALIS